MDESIIRACVLFFLVTLEDESLVYAASESAINSARRRKFQDESENLYSLAISEATKVYLSGRHKFLGQPRPLEIDYLPSKELLEDLKKLRGQIPDRLFISFVWSEVAKAPRHEIANGLGITAGTVDHRSYEVLKQWAEAQ